MSESFEHVVTREMPGLLRFATALCGDRDQAQDLVQEVLARAYAKWDRVGSTERPAAYLTRMVANEFVSWRRRWSTRSVMVLEDSDLDRAADDVRDHSTDVVERDDLARRLARLPRRQQTALVLRYFQGVDYTESAAILGCAEATVRSACARGLATLRLDASVGPARPLLTTETS